MDQMLMLRCANTCWLAKPDCIFRSSAETKATYQEETVVKFLLNMALASLVVLSLICAPLASAVGQQDGTGQGLKPVAVVSIASIKENLADVGYVTRAAGMADYGDTAKFFASALSAGIDKERPIGLYVVPKMGDFHAVAFVPLE